FDNRSRMRFLESALRRRVSRRENAAKLGPRAKFVGFFSVAIGSPLGDTPRDGKNRTLSPGTRPEVAFRTEIMPWLWSPRQSTGRQESKASRHASKLGEKARNRRVSRESRRRVFCHPSLASP